MPSFSKLLGLAAGVSAVAADPSGTYQGSTSVLGISVKASLKIDDSSHSDITITGPVTISCAKEAYNYDGKSKISFPDQSKSGDCVNTALSKYKASIASATYDSGSDSISMEVKAESIIDVKITLKKSSTSDKEFFSGIGTEACCNTCEEPKEKYYSIDTAHGFCGECCMEPKSYPLYKIFEPGLKKATDNNPCKDNKYSKYSNTVTHGFGPIKMTLDLYSPDTVLTSLLPSLTLGASSSSHYEDPKPNGCLSDEQAIQIQGVAGDFCTPKCSGMTCPSDVPSGVTATPTCALQDTSGNKYCALLCSPSQNDACGTNASCKSISGVGICTYDD